MHKTSTLHLILVALLAWAGSAVAESDRSPGKPTAPVTMTAAPIHLAAGDRGVTQLEFTASQPVDALRVWVGPSEGLHVTPVEQASDGSLAAGQAMLVSAEFLADADGRHYLNVLAQTTRGGITRMRAFAVPVHVGDGKRRLAPPGQAKTGPNGEPVISLTARETVRQAAAE